MDVYSRKTEVRWSDLDPNYHVRHSVYYDWPAYIRLAFFNEQGLTPEMSFTLNIGPILFREECIFKREIKLGDSIETNLRLLKCRRDISRWSLAHEIWKNGETLCAVVTVDGALIDTRLRRLTVPPAIVQQVFGAMPRTENFEWQEG